MLRNIGLMRRRPPQFLAQCADRYGPVARFPMPRAEVWLVTDPDDVRRVLQVNHKAYGKRTIQYDTLALVTGTGLLASDADLWRRMRRVMSPGFHHSLLAGMATSVHAATAEWVERVLAAPRDRELDMDAEMLGLTLEIVAATLLGGRLAGRSDQLVEAVMSALRFVVKRAQQPMPLPEAWATPGRRRLRAALQTLDGAVADVIASRRRAGPGSDVLWLLISALDEGVVTPEEVRDEVVTLIVAGHETVAATLTWTWVLLAAHPDAEQRLHSEVDALGDPAPRDWGADLLDRLPYTRAVVDECLRLYPPAWVITRRSLEPDVLGGFELPVGATVILSPYVVQRDARWWPDPERFDPERFLGPAAPTESGRSPLTYFPFGAGPRLCIGRDLALLEAPLVVAAVARALRVRPVRPASVEPDFGVTLRPKGGLPAQVVGRRKRPAG
jgi:cytochrome P450